MSATPSATPRIEPTPLESAGAFVTHAGLIVDEVSPTRVRGHIELSSDHHTPWGIVHGGVYSTAVESAASIGASAAVRDDGQVAVGLTNTTHFLRVSRRRPGPGRSRRLLPGTNAPVVASRHHRRVRASGRPR